MFWLFTGIIGVGLVVIWNIFVHPVQSIATLLKLGLGVGGIIFLLAGILGNNFGNGALGVFVLIGASMIGYLQGRKV
jgi:hypothetical protein